MFSPSALPLGACKEDRNTYAAAAGVEDTQKICHWRDLCVTAKESLHSTHTAFSHLGTRSHAPGWLPLSYMWNCLPPYTAITLLPYQCRFTTQHHKHGFNWAVGLNPQLCALHQGESTASPRCSLPATWELQQCHCTQSAAGSFLRDRIFAKQHAHLASDEEQDWKGSVTNIQLPTNPISEDATATESVCLPQKHILGNTQLNSTKPCAPLNFRPTHPMRSQPFQLLRVKGKKQWLLSNIFSALFYIGLWQIRVLKDPKFCEV